MEFQNILTKSSEFTQASSSQQVSCAHSNDLLHMSSSPSADKLHDPPNPPRVVPYIRRRPCKRPHTATLQWFPFMYVILLNLTSLLLSINRIIYTIFHYYLVLACVHWLQKCGTWILKVDREDTSIMWLVLCSKQPPVARKFSGIYISNFILSVTATYLPAFFFAPGEG